MSEKINLLALDPKNYSFWRRLVQIASILAFVLIPVLGIFRFDFSSAATVIMGKYYTWDEILVTYMIWLFLVSVYYFVGMIFGRVFCGWSCPQNLWAEIADFFLFKIFGFGTIREKKSKVFTKEPAKGIARPLYAVGAVLLVVVVSLGLWLVGGSYFVPSSRMLYDLAHPNVSVIIVWVAIFSAMSGFFFFGHWYCKIMCPVGMIPALTWTKKTMSLQFDKSRDKECVNCNQCFAGCVTQINVKDAAGDSKRFCINCGVCADVCAKKMAEDHNPKGSLLQITPGPQKGWPFQIILAGAAIVVSAILIGYGFLIHEDVKVLVSGKSTLGKAFDTKNHTANFTVTVINKDSKPHDFNIKINGIPEGSYRIDNSVLLSLQPGKKETMALVVALSNPQIRKGTTELTVEAISTDTKIHNTDSVQLFKPDMVK